MFKFKQLLAGLGIASALVAGGAAHAATMPIFSTGFDGVSQGTLPAGFVPLNRSTNASAGGWGGGNSGLFGAQAGAAGSYIADSYAASFSGTGVVSDWLLTPVFTIGNGYTFTFYTRADVDTLVYPDSLQIRLSTSGASTNVGTSPTDVGVFTTLLLSVNAAFAPSGYPQTWTQYTATVSGLPALTTGRFALRYFLPDVSAQGSYIGVDSIVITAVPEPETTLMLALGLGVMGLSLRRKARRQQD